MHTISASCSKEGNRPHPSSLKLNSQMTVPIADLVGILYGRRTTNRKEMTMYFLLISCVALFGVCEHFVSAAPSPTEAQYDSTEQSNTSIGTNADASTRNTQQQQGCPCSDGTFARSDRLMQQDFGHLYNRNMLVHGMMCMCNVPVRNSPMRDDYHYTVGIGSHKLHTRVATWNEARKACNEEGGHLAIINSMTEEHVSESSIKR